MSDIKSAAQGLVPSAEARDVSQLAESTGNIYEALAVISRRAEKIQVEIKEELAQKLSQFVETGETIEEITENKEQIEISRSYERLPNPALIATNEFLTDELHAEYREPEPEQEVAPPTAPAAPRF